MTKKDKEIVRKVINKMLYGDLNAVSLQHLAWERKLLADAKRPSIFALKNINPSNWK